MDQNSQESKQEQIYHSPIAMTPFRVLLFQFYPLLLLPLFLQTVSTFPHKVPRLSPHHKEAIILRNPDDSLSASAITKDFQTYFYTQTLDHFNYAPQSYATFRQRYVVNSKHWGGPSPNSPIFAYLGAEAPLDDDLDVIGFLNDNAPYFKSLSVFIEVKLISICVCIYILIHSFNSFDSLFHIFSNCIFHFIIVCKHVCII